MSVAMIAQCGDLPLDPIAKSVLMVLADNSDQYGICRLPATELVCARVGWPVYLVFAAIQEFERIGLLELLSDDDQEYRLRPTALKADRIAWPGPSMNPVRR